MGLFAERTSGILKEVTTLKVGGFQDVQELGLCWCWLGLPSSKYAHKRLVNIRIILFGLLGIQYGDQIMNDQLT